MVDVRKALIAFMKKAKAFKEREFKKCGPTVGKH